jgi:hypothetical protein
MFSILTPPYEQGGERRQGFLFLSKLRCVCVGVGDGVGEKGNIDV